MLNQLSDPGLGFSLFLKEAARQLQKLLLGVAPGGNLAKVRPISLLQMSTPPALGNKAVSAVGSEGLWGAFFSFHYSAPREGGAARLQGPSSQPGPQSVFPEVSWPPRGKKCPGPGAPRTGTRAAAGGGGRGNEKVSSGAGSVTANRAGREAGHCDAPRRGERRGRGRTTGPSDPGARSWRRAARRLGGAHAPERVLGGAGGTRRSHALGPLPGAGFIFRFRRALRRRSGAL